MATKPKVLLLGKIEHAHDAWSAIADMAQVVEPQAADREAFMAECRSGALDGVAVAYRTFASVAVTGRIDGPLLDAMPSSLKFICHNA
ncbi:hypothetical protein CDD83_4802 [Cordyceps sp. RAO-2017]|nr:hypothetical protein CDD83_4802 [Cordyceps sp. RAO-2017]